jgi:hypothetical protein
MQSKQGKRRQASQITRTTVSKVVAKKAKPRRRAQRQNEKLGAVSRTVVKSAPLNRGVLRQGGSRVTFGKADPHDRYSEGGMRIFAVQQSYYSLYAPDSTGLGAVSNSHYQYLSVSPTSVFLNDTSNMIFLFSTANTFTSLCGSFDEYRIRKLILHYVPLVGTNTTGGENLATQLSVSYFHTINDDNIETDPSKLTNGTTVNFPIWEPTDVTLIPMTKGQRSDNLYRTGTIGDAVGTHVIANQLIQGQIAINHTAYGTTASDYPIGNLWVEIVVDLYGFRTYWPGENEETKSSIYSPSEKAAINDLRKIKAARLRQQRRSDLDADLLREVKRVDLLRGNDSRHTPQPDEKELRSFDFVDLSPRSKREKETPPPSVRASSEKGSRRA